MKLTEELLSASQATVYKKDVRALRMNVNGLFNTLMYSLKAWISAR